MTAAVPLNGGILDDPIALGRLDRADMLGAVASLPNQVRDAWALSRTLDLQAGHRAARAVAVLGMGGSAIGGDLVRDIWADRLKVPVAVVRGYDVPAWVGPETLVVASSYSGATEETISAMGQALERRCPVSVISTGGPVLEVARRAGLPYLSFPGGGQPRAAVGYAVMLLAGMLERAGMLDLGDDEVAAAAQAADEAVVANGPAAPTAGNPAKALAWALVDRVPVIEASGFLTPVARRWKTQFNENGKTHAVWEELPEATHNAVVGYPQPESILEHLLVVFLTSDRDEPRNVLRGELSRELLDAAGIGHRVIRVAGSSRFAEALAAIVPGDYASVYVAALYGIDPTPVEAITRLKLAMAAADQPHRPDDGPTRS